MVCLLSPPAVTATKLAVCIVGAWDCGQGVHWQTHKNVPSFLWFLGVCPAGDEVRCHFAVTTAREAVAALAAHVSHGMLHCRLSPLAQFFFIFFKKMLRPAQTGAATAKLQRCFTALRVWPFVALFDHT
jgi:hypothetical protein